MLYICEKPSQAKDIAGALGAALRKDGYFEKAGIKVTWCFGHLLSLYMPEEYDAKYKKWSMGNLPIIPDKFLKKISKSSAKQYKVIKELLKTEKEVVIATDADREGEMIAREILDQVKWAGQVKRLWLHALDEASIRKGLNGLLDGNKTKSLYYAAYARQIADWLIGMNYTGYYTLISNNYGSVSSIGRVQTPTLKFVVDRDTEIENFISKTYFELEGLFNYGTDFKAKWDNKNEDKVFDKKTIEDIKRKLLPAKSGIVTNSKKEEKTSLPPKLFSLSTLQKFINQKYGYSAQEVLDTVQSLYETFKYATYPRTDCEYLPVSQLPEAGTIINNAPFKIEAQARKVYQFDDSKITAHHAIIPTTVKPDINKVNEIQKNIYLEIYKRYISMFYPDLITYVTSLEINVSGEPFKSSGTEVKSIGWKTLYPGQDKEDKEPKVPFIEKGTKVDLRSLNILEKQTTPAARFTDSSLLEAMKNAGKFIDDKEQKDILKETQGLGTEATRASIIEKLIKTEYLKRNKKQLISTEKGRRIISAVDNALKSPATTAVWESKLKEIEEGKISLDIFLSEIKKDLAQKLTGLKKSNITLNGGSSMEKQYLEGVKCPLCGSKLVYFSKGFKCEKQKWDGKETTGCNFTLWSTQFGQKLSDKDILNLLSGKKVAGKFKITSKAGKTYEAPFIYLDDNGEVKLEFSNKK